jgi:DNA-directed RNA polymerase specialized sigma24 family protein
VLRKVQQRITPISSPLRDLVEESVGSALLDYNDDPDRYDPQRAQLFEYLATVAYGHFRNAWKKERRVADRSVLLSDLDAHTQDSLLDQQDLDAPIQAQELWAYIQTEFVDAVERRVIVLMLNDVSETTAYSQILGIGHLSQEEQEKDVKRIKERIGKRLRRIVRRHSQ